MIHLVDMKKGSNASNNSSDGSAAAEIWFDIICGGAEWAMVKVFVFIEILMRINVIHRK